MEGKIATELKGIKDELHAIRKCMESGTKVEITDAVAEDVNLALGRLAQRQATSESQQ